MTHQLDVSRHPYFPEVATRKLQELSDSIRLSLEHGRAADLAHGLQSVAKIAELTPPLRDSIRNRLADTRFFGRPPTIYEYLTITKDRAPAIGTGKAGTVNQERVANGWQNCMNS